VAEAVLVTDVYSGAIQIRLLLLLLFMGNLDR